MGLGLYVLIQVLFASFLTSHFWLCLEIFKHDAKKAALGFVLAPMAPYIALHFRIRKLAALWILTGSSYLVFLLLALLLPGAE